MADVRIPKSMPLTSHQSIVHLPDAPLLIAGGFGGPLIIGGLTPLRNACTLAAQDTHSTGTQIYRKVFSRGLLSGWTGLTGPSCAAIVQFTTLGPGYHVYLGLLGNPAAAVLAGAVTETFITYGPTTRNSQLMHNSLATPAKNVPLRPMFPVGPGFASLCARNVCSNAGIRVLSDPLSSVVAQATGDKKYTDSSQISGVSRMAGDFLASVLCGGLSMPFNQLYNFQVTSNSLLAARPNERALLSLDFLKSQYLVSAIDGSSRLSRLVLRDACLRSCYIGFMFGSYATFERFVLSILR